jgi:cell division protein FtsB
MQTKRAGLGTKFVVLVLLVACVSTLLSMNERIDAARAERDRLSREATVLAQVNAKLAEDIENREDPEQIADIARDKLGLLEQDEMVFVDTSN